MILQVAMVISNTNHVGLIHQASIAPGRPYRQHFQCQPQLRHGIWLAKKQAKHAKIQGGIHSHHRTSLDSPTFCSKLCSMMARNLGLECAVSKNGSSCLAAMSIFRRVLESNSFAYGGYLDQTNCWSWGKSKLEVTRKERREVSLTTAKCCRGFDTGQLRIWWNSSDIQKSQGVSNHWGGYRDTSFQLPSNSVQHICQRCDNGHLWITYELVLLGHWAQSPSN